MGSLGSEDSTTMTGKKPSDASRTRDFSTLSNAEDLSAKFMRLDLNVDFEKKSLRGSVSYVLSVRDIAKSELQQLVLDTNGGLQVERVEISPLLDGKTVREDGGGAGGEDKHVGGSGWYVPLGMLVSLKDESREIPFKLLPNPHAVFGRSLHILLDVEQLHQSSPPAEGEKFVIVRIYYQTGSEALSTQWVEPSATSGKKLPYLFTQCQAIHARSLLPCQDCPAAKCAYAASITCPEWAQALMSAVLVEGGADVESTSSTGGEIEKKTKTFHFRQKIPVPSYLIAIVVGNIVRSKISDRVDVWSEPEDIERVAFEFDEAEEYLQIAEEITGLQYQWGRYDVLSLPPSFPYGGMENPCLTFVTPTLLAGDKSLADVVAHEISHSWTGNVITNRTWEHFWLNEGWTVWLERKIKKEFVRRRFGHKAAIEAHAVASQVGVAHLQAAVEHFYATKNPEYTRLVPNLENDIDPDDVFSAVPYERGCNLLHTIEQMVGEEVFMEKLVKGYIEKFKFKTITAAEFREFCVGLFPQELGGAGVGGSGDGTSKLKLDWDVWFYSEGMPELPFPFQSETIAKAGELVADWGELSLTDSDSLSDGAQQLKTSTKACYESWRTEQKLVFFEALNKQLAQAPEKWTTAKFLALKGCFEDLKTTKNCELLFQWYMLVLKSVDQGDGFWETDCKEGVTNMLTSQGRMKYTRPLYRSLAKKDLNYAKELFEGNRSFYHPICQTVVAKDLANVAAEGKK
eukprot:g10502.t1